MLSGETSVGAFPIETVRTMAAIIESTEENGGERIASIPVTSRRIGPASFARQQPVSPSTWMPVIW